VRALPRTCLAMAKGVSSDQMTERNRVVRRLSALFGWSIAAQAGAFLAIAWMYRLAAQALLDLTASSTGDRSSAFAAGGVAAVVVLLDLFLSLVVGFFGARRLLRAIVRTTPHPMKPPVQPIPLASLCAAVLAVTVSVFVYASRPDRQSGTWYGWLVELARDGAVIVLFWYAARRAVRPKAA
jgi:hypothetical protein